MAEHRMICPHCRVTKWMHARAGADISNQSGYFLAICENCQGPVVLLVEAHRPKWEFRRIGDLQSADCSFEQCGWRVQDSWPKPEFRTGTAPQGVPEQIGALLEHSHEAAAKGGFDLAIMGYQRVVRMAQMIVSPEFGGTCRSWVLFLIDSGRLTRDISKWVKRLKLRGEIEGATAVQAEEFATFVHVILEQIFGTRSRMALSRSGAAG